MPADRKLLNHLRDPQSWVCLIAVSTLLGLCAGAFEPIEALPAADMLVASAQPAQP